MIQIDTTCSPWSGFQMSFLACFFAKEKLVNLLCVYILLPLQYKSRCFERHMDPFNTLITTLTLLILSSLSFDELSRFDHFFGHYEMFL